MKVKVEQNPVTNLNPTLSISSDGTVLYSNEASEPILTELGVRVGEKLPSNIVDLVQRVILYNSPEKMELKVGNKVYLVVFHPLLKEQCVNISGFDISDQKELDEKLHEDEEKYHKIYNLIEGGVAICELVLDEEGQPIDVNILEANPAYEKHSGLRRELVIRRSLNEVLSTLEHKWLDRCGELIHTGTGTHFQEYNAFLDKWFDVFASPMGGNRFFAVFNDITELKRVEKSEECLKALMDHNPSIVFLKDECGRYVYLNKAYEKQFVLSKDWYGKTDFDFWSKESAELFRTNDSDVLKSGHTHQFLEDSNNLDGTRFCWLCYKFTFTDSKNKRYIGGIGIDATDRVRAEEALAFERSQLLSIFDGMEDMIYVADPHTYEILYVNKALKEKFGSEYMGGICYRKFQRRDSPCDFCTNRIILKERGKPYLWEHYNPKVDRFFMIMDRIIKWPDGRDVRLEIAKDITELKKTEENFKKANETLEEKVKERTSELEQAYESLRKSEMSLAEAQKMAHIGNWEWDIASDKAFWSEEMYRIFKRDPQQLAPSLKEYLSYIHPDDLDYYCKVNDYTKKIRTSGLDFRIVLADGEERTLHIKSDFIFNEENIPIRVKGIVQDITERKKVEDVLVKTEIVRKQEIHHRIKNNLQVISSLLDLQAEKFKGEKSINESLVLEAFKESQDRVISMALIHEELHKGGETDTLNISHYIEELAGNLFLTYRLGNESICLDTDIDHDIFLNMDTSVPLGIIVNELVSNSLKHAFSGREKGEISIKLQRDQYNNTTFTLSVSDNGIGIPEDIDIEDLDSLGLQLVTTLVEQLDGALEIKRDEGTEFIIRFKVQDNNLPSTSASQFA